MTEQTEDRSDEVLEVFWRPGCAYCYRLLDTLEEAQVAFRMHNIWEDDTARTIVAGINGGNETVPTIVLGALSATNPDPDALLHLLRAEHPALFPAATS